MKKTEVINVVIAIAKAEVGYLEKASNSNLDSKTANAGYNNYTKYWRDIANWGLGNYQAQYWCAAFVHWCFVNSFGLEKTKALLLHAPYISCATLGSKSNSVGQRYTTPQIGDVAIFWNGSRFSHTGYVYAVDDSRFYTIEGNTSGASAVVANGGGVYTKSYGITTAQNVGHRFHRPDYVGVLGVSSHDSSISSTAIGSTATTNNNVSTNVKTGQAWFNSNYKAQLIKYCGAPLVLDGEYGKDSRRAALAVFKDLLNRKYSCTLDPNNTNFQAGTKAAAKHAVVRVNSSGTFTYIVQFILSAKGYYKGTMDAACGAELDTAIKTFQIARNLTADGVAGVDTLYALFN